MANDLINYIYVVMPPLKTPTEGVWSASRPGEDTEGGFRRVAAWRGHGMPSPTPCPMRLFHKTVPDLYSFITN